MLAETGGKSALLGKSMDAFPARKGRSTVGCSTCATSVIADCVPTGNGASIPLPDPTLSKPVLNSTAKQTHNSSGFLKEFLGTVRWLLTVIEFSSRPAHLRSSLASCVNITGVVIRVLIEFSVVDNNPEKLVPEALAGNVHGASCGFAQVDDK